MKNSRVFQADRICFWLEGGSQSVKIRFYFAGLFQDVPCV